MNLLKLSWKNIKSRPLNALISFLLLSLGVGMMSLLWNMSDQLTKQLTNNVKGIDLVVGAKGSPLQLVLSNLYHIDSPTGNIDLEEANKIKNHPLIAKAIPLSVGDSYKGFRIIGTDSNFISHYRLSLQDGKFWQQPLQAVVGSQVAEDLNIWKDSHFHGSHGLAEGVHSHDDKEYEVVGVLAPTGSVADQLILTSIESVWNLHEKENKDAEGKKSITALLVKFLNPSGLIQLPRFINEQTNMQAAVPAVEVNRLFSLMGMGIQTMRWIAFALMGISAISIFLSLLSTLKDRVYEMALMRTLGASRWKLLSMVLLEGIILCLFGYLFGIVLSKIGMIFSSKYLSNNFHYQMNIFEFGDKELWLLALTLIIAIVAAIIPAISAFQTNISKTLSNE